jgi:hypothetical protein
VDHSEDQLNSRILDDALDGLQVLEIPSVSQDSPVPATPATVWTPSVLLDTAEFEGVVGLAIFSDARAVLFSFFCPVYH